LSVLLQVQLPAGTITVPPLPALATAVCTSLWEQELAVTVDALLVMVKPRTANASKHMVTVTFRFLIS